MNSQMTWGILLDALVCRGCFGRGRNPDFLVFYVLADVENYELP
jgi:hypothetical protein